MEAFWILATFRSITLHVIIRIHTHTPTRPRVKDLWLASRLSQSSSGGHEHGQSWLALPSRRYLGPGGGPAQAACCRSAPGGGRLADQSLSSSSQRLEGSEREIGNHWPGTGLISNPPFQSRSSLLGWWFKASIAPSVASGVAPGHRAIGPGSLQPTRRATLGCVRTRRVALLGAAGFYGPLRCEGALRPIGWPPTSLPRQTYTPIRDPCPAQIHVIPKYGAVREI